MREMSSSFSPQHARLGEHEKEQKGRRKEGHGGMHTDTQAIQKGKEPVKSDVRSCAQRARLARFHQQGHEHDKQAILQGIHFSDFGETPE